MTQFIFIYGYFKIGRFMGANFQFTNLPEKGLKF